MSTKGSFDLPEYKHQSTGGARRAYEKMWGRKWPHDDDYLRQLAREVRELKNEYPTTKVCEVLLNAMRENHEFEEPSNERLAQAFNDSGVFKPFTCVPGK
jgi:hypothetical protein